MPDLLSRGPVNPATHERNDEDDHDICSWSAPNGTGHDVPRAQAQPPKRPLLARCTFAAPGTVAVCALSGDPDSAALVALAVAANLDASASHVDHDLAAEPFRLQPPSVHERLE
jgi:hypothetical protein